MEIIKLEDYKEDCVCAVKNQEVKYIDYPDKDEILEYIRDGFKIYGVIPIEVFDDNFIENDIQGVFETQVENEGYEDMNEFINYDSEEFKKVKEAVRNFIKSLGTTGIKYRCDENTVIEVDIPKCIDCIYCREFSNGELYCQDRGFYIENDISCSFFKENKMSLKKLVDNGIDLEFEIKNKKYIVSKEFEKEVYIIYSCTRYKYIGFTEYETEDSDIYLEFKEWNEIEVFIKRLVEKNGK